MIELLEYVGKDGKSPYERWFSALNSEAAARVSTALYRLSLGNLSNAKSVGSGVHEARIDFGPGYRVYFGKDGDVLVILLTGGSKKRQQQDIALAHQLWERYKQQKDELKKEQAGYASDQRL